MPVTRLIKKAPRTDTNPLLFSRNTFSMYSSISLDLIILTNWEIVHYINSDIFLQKIRLFDILEFENIWLIQGNFYETFCLVVIGFVMTGHVWLRLSSLPSVMNPANIKDLLNSINSGKRLLWEWLCKKNMTADSWQTVGIHTYDISGHHHSSHYYLGSCQLMSIIRI